MPTTLRDWLQVFYAKPALFIELYLTLQTDFASVVFGFLPMTLLLNKSDHPCYRDLLSAAQ